MNRTTPEYKLWRANVYARDGWKCKLCDSKIRIEAHHIYPLRTHQHLALELINGITLCFKCHRTIFGKEIQLANIFKNLLENGVNSVKLPPSNVEDNPEPTQERNLLKGVTTRSQGYTLEQFITRQIPCSQCHTLISRHYYRIKRTKHFFCNVQCKSLFMKGKVALNKKKETVKICKFCKSEMPSTPSDVHRNKQFCNNSCHLKYLWRVQKRNPVDVLKGKWSKEYLACIICQKTDTRHYGKGKCMRCYNREYRQ